MAEAEKTYVIRVVEFEAPFEGKIGGWHCQATGPGVAIKAEGPFRGEVVSAVLDQLREEIGGDDGSA